MPNNYRTMVHYHTKPGMEEELMFLNENQLLSASKNTPFYQREIWQDENDPSHLIATAVFHSKKEAQNFHSNLDALKSQLMRSCEGNLEEEFLQVTQGEAFQPHQNENYHVLLHYHAKSGLEKQLRSQIEQIFFQHPQKDIHQIEFLQNPNDSSIITLSGACDTLEEVKNFQLNWEAHKKELESLCSQEPHQETFHINRSYPD